MCQCVGVRVGILGGTGPLGRGLAVRLAAAGTAVTVGSRDPERATAVVGEVLGQWPGRALDLTGGPNEEAAGADVVVVSTPWDAAVPTVRPLAGALEGKLVVSVANALVKQGRELHPLIPPRGSVAAAVQAALPGSRLAAAGHHLPAASLEDLDEVLGADVLVCSDQDEARARTMDLVSSIAGLRPLDAGSLASASAIEAFTAVLVNLNIRYKGHSTLRLAGLDHVGATAP